MSGGYVSFPGEGLNKLDRRSLPIGGTNGITVVSLTRRLPSTGLRTIAAEWLATSQGLSWIFARRGNNQLQFNWSTTGDNGINIIFAADFWAVIETWIWRALTFVPDDGAGRRVARAWTSTDGAAWVLYDTATVVGATSIFDSASDFTIGSNTGGANTWLGDIGYVSVYSGTGPDGTVGGTEVFRFDGCPDLTGVDPKATSFEVSLGGTLEVLRSGVPDTRIVPCDFDCDRTYGGEIGHVDLPGTAGNWLSAPSTSIGGTGGLSITARVRRDPAAGTFNSIVAEWDATHANGRSFLLRYQPNNLRLFWTEDNSTLFQDTSDPHGFAVGEWQWLGATLVPDNGAGAHETRFFESADGITFNQFGPTITGAPTTVLDSESLLSIGAINDGTDQQFLGDIADVSVRAGTGPNGTIGGPEVFRFDGNRDLNGVDPEATSFDASIGGVLTVHRQSDPETQLHPPDVSGTYGDCLYGGAELPHCDPCLESVPCPQQLTSTSSPLDRTAQLVPCPPGKDC